MEPIEKTHGEAVAMIADTVAGLTRRALEPALAPFETALAANIARWEEQLGAVEGIVPELREAIEKLAKQQDGTASAVAQLAGAQRALAETQLRQDGLLNSARARDEAFAEQVSELRALSDAQGQLERALSDSQEQLMRTLSGVRQEMARALSGAYSEMEGELRSVQGELTRTHGEAQRALSGHLDAQRASMGRAWRFLSVGLVILFAEILALGLVLLARTH